MLAAVCSRLIAATAEGRSPAATAASASMSRASRHDAIGIGLADVGYLPGLQIGVTRSCPTTFAFATATRGSAALFHVTFRKLGSTLEKLPRYVCVLTRFSRRAFTAE